MSLKITGMIADIQRGSLHDGPGIRTTVFMKGCNLRCAWCHNPETISFEPEELFYPGRCIHCGGCERGCFSGARALCGRLMTVEDVTGEALKDQDYYGIDGGVTISGGEPTCQSGFVVALLRKLKEAKVHTAIETNLHCSPEVLVRMEEHLDLVMADLKFFDSARHRQFTGVGNEHILRNLAALTRPLILRTPVVSSLNDTEEEIGAIARFAVQLPTLLSYELLPYHPLGLSKGVGAQERFSAPDKDRMDLLAKAARECGAQVRVRGRVSG